MRLFILALLLPAYGFAAVHVEPYLVDEPPAHAPAFTAGSAQDDGKSLLSELSDTTDDACDHCIAYAVEVTVQRARLWDLPIEQPRVPDAVPRQLLRPPRVLRR
ncbi:hypothetical protein ACG02S_19450 [Roseateles sp. DC23W]|uniref:Uncharacterized protein n=1 Tax=Pelomonas dachongensis TaxID=3299029 RepID=A0ABW7EU03_9BURK